MAIRDGKVLITVFGFFISVVATGCCMIIPAKPVQPAYITAEPPYTARLMFPYKKGEKVRKFKIYEYKDIERFPGWERTLCWHIKATKPVPAEGFGVTIGNVPNGFKQVVPKQNMPFVPILNSDYLVEIITTNRNVHYLTWWYPGSPKMLHAMLRP
jgi:hypothetical protein